jgi:hypothetical protein
MLSFEVAFFIVDFVSISNPADPILIIFLREGERLETIAKKRLFFDQVHDV